MEWFWPEGFYALAMVPIFALGSFALKSPISVAMVLAAISGSLIAGRGIPIRHLVEGAFGYLDTILIIATAMIFMKTVQYTGLLEAVAALAIRRFCGRPLLLSLCIMAIIMFPGMITGSSTAAVLTAEALAAPIMMKLGVPRAHTAAAMAMAAIYGMAAPPVNIPAMIIGGGIDMPYVGFTVPLPDCTVPLAAFVALTLVYSRLRRQASGRAGAASPAGLLTGRKWNPVEAVTEAVNDALPVMAILVGVGMFIRVMTLNGMRGFFVVSALALPVWALYLGRLYIPHKGDQAIDLRVARHVAAALFVETLGDVKEGRGTVMEGIPSFGDILRNKVGSYLAAPNRPGA